MVQLNRKLATVVFTGAVILFSYSTASAQSETQKNEAELKSSKATMENVLLVGIEGMHCQSGCANGIDAMLKEQEGIIESTTSFENNSAEIRYDSSMISEEKIIGLIKERGFEVRVISKEIDHLKNP